MPLPLITSCIFLPLDGRFVEYFLVMHFHFPWRCVVVQWLACMAANFSNILFITPASISATFFSSLPLPFQLHFFHHSRFHFSNICFITPDSTSATFLSSILLSFHTNTCHQSRFNFSHT